MSKMKIATFLSVVMLVSITFLAGCLTPNEGDRDPPGYETRYTGMNELVNISNEFSFDMYRGLVNGDDNVFFSPYSIVIALGMAYEGARGETAIEIQSVIDLPGDNEARREMVRSLQSQLNPEGMNYELSTANAYWLRVGEDLNDEYQDTIENDYLAGGQDLDFVNDASGSADTINQWVEGETNGRIKDLISPSMISADTYLILTNAIYFKANWRWQFDEDATLERKFYFTDGSSEMVDTMNMCDEDIDLNYAENDDVQLLQLPYKDEELSMYILLPKENDISFLESELTSDYLNDLKSDMYGEWVDVYLPKFKFEQKYTLNDPLIALGMEKAFDPNEADFSGIKESGDPLFISRVIHQSFVEVNEEGTEAAAATAVIMENSASPIGGSEPRPVEFRADHPFIFFIEHKETGQILFMGKVEDPTV
ncbi:MAG: serpin family protein [Candidatus Thermoplasmatota archaeon]|nr:serpin family protein [Candidatus Thermoplasmatota archaeon]